MRLKSYKGEHIWARTVNNLGRTGFDSAHEPTTDMSIDHAAISFQSLMEWKDADKQKKWCSRSV